MAALDTIHVTAWLGGRSVPGPDKAVLRNHLHTGKQVHPAIHVRVCAEIFSFVEEVDAFTPREVDLVLFFYGRVHAHVVLLKFWRRLVGWVEFLLPTVRSRKATKGTHFRCLQYRRSEQKPCLSVFG